MPWRTWWLPAAALLALALTLVDQLAGQRADTPTPAVREDPLPALARAEPARALATAGAADADGSAAAAALPIEAGPELEPSLAAELEEELRWTERALGASRRLSDSLDSGRDVQPAAAPRPIAGGSAAVACTSEGRSCLSSSECCAGLACAGGIAGYGTRGVCEAAR